MPSKTMVQGLAMDEQEHLLAVQAGGDGGDIASMTTTATTDDDGSGGNASVVQTVLNLMKTCMGTGVLALSFACQQGGSVLYCLGLPAIALWNVYAVHRLVLCLALISDKKMSLGLDHPKDSTLQQASRLRRQNATQQQQSKQLLTEPILPTEPMEQPPAGVSTMGRVAWHAFGGVGLQLLDASMLTLLLGIIVAYVAGSVTFLGDTPLSLGSSVVNGLVCASCMALISLVPHVGHLSWVSATGLLVLLGTFVVIAGYGVKDHVLLQQSKSIDWSAIPLLPASMSGVSHLFGIAVFSFGVAPLTYNFRSSMQQPQKMVAATCIALSLTSVSYIVLGLGMLLFYPKLTGDLLHELPTKGMLPVVTRLAMVWVCIMTAPLLIIPCSELVEGKWHIHTSKRMALRFGICLAAVFIAIAMPSFVQVLALVGCACVGLVGFCLPPLFHLKLSAALSQDYVSQQTSTWVLDAVMLTWGIAVTILSTYFTFQRVRHE